MSLLKRLIIPGAVAVVLVAATSLISETENVEADLTQRAGAVLADNDMDWAQIRFDGRDGTLIGEAPEEGVADRAIDLIELQRGVRMVSDETTLLAKRSPYTFGSRGMAADSR